ncbi:MAG: hypothetical protein HZB23_02285 [Deltaproteobacteria bacterium]|nr:hypothetical protein [Deltaproteobacteria bacterium]
MKKPQAGKSSCLAIFFIIFFLRPALGGNAENWRNEVPCGRRLPEMQSVEKTDCKHAYEASLPNGGQLSVCVESGTDDSFCDVANILYRAKNGAVKEWKFDINQISGFQYRLDAVDFAGNGHEVILLGVMRMMTSGICIAYWTVWALSEDGVSDGLLVEDYGRMGFPTRSNGEPGALMLATQWRGGTEPDRGFGKYLLGVWYRYENGNWHSVLYDRDHPVIYRRYLFSHEKERDQGAGAEDYKPVTWYRHKSARPVVGPYPDDFLVEP